MLSYTFQPVWLVADVKRARAGASDVDVDEAGGQSKRKPSKNAATWLLWASAVALRLCERVTKERPNNKRALTTVKTKVRTNKAGTTPYTQRTENERSFRTRTTRTGGPVSCDRPSLRDEDFLRLSHPCAMPRASPKPHSSHCRTVAHSHQLALTECFLEHALGQPTHDGHTCPHTNARIISTQRTHTPRHGIFFIACASCQLSVCICRQLCSITPPPRLRVAQRER